MCILVLYSVYSVKISWKKESLRILTRLGYTYVDLILRTPYGVLPSEYRLGFALKHL